MGASDEGIQVTVVFESVYMQCMLRGYHGKREKKTRCSAGLLLPSSVLSDGIYLYPELVRQSASQQYCLCPHHTELTGMPMTDFFVMLGSRLRASILHKKRYSPLTHLTSLVFI